MTADAPLEVSAAITLANIAAADLNGDGKLDLASANTVFSTVSVVSGRGDGTFNAPVNVGVANSPRALAVADVSGDGKPDLAVVSASATASTLGLVINTTSAVGGALTFGGGPSTAIANGPTGIVAGDWNRDGKPDLAIAMTGEANVKILLATGANAFAAPVSVAVASAGNAIAAGDLDGDGDLDLVVTCSAANAVHVLRNAGNGTFSAAGGQLATRGTNPAAIAIGDLDGDGRPEVVVGNAGSADVSVLYNRGTGPVAAELTPIGVAASSITIADLDRDGHPDLAIGASAPFASVLLSGR